MRVCVVFLVFLGSLIVAGCTNQTDTMSLLDEKIEKIEISKSKGMGSVNEEIFLVLDDNESINVMKKVITFAVMNENDIPMKEPDYDVVVSYGDQFPKHAIHIWLGNEGEDTILSYLVEDGGTYKTSVKNTKKLRELILGE
ncbi:hypothetical protein [Bacillus suaedaesalsae]|uniref:YhfM-like domain-containing protein n=1 Tax=Bacillus suaedaesalsae TaxID=2810349 RepID=A0ABS2DKG1_9BACI|nr:hypothetical protein [Bacillus suaedaesalsae]MBM6618011.1 hypothetical protein [Bacillus suaedaesalsae]